MQIIGFIDRLDDRNQTERESKSTQCWATHAIIASIKPGVTLLKNLIFLIAYNEGHKTKIKVSNGSNYYF